MRPRFHSSTVDPRRLNLPDHRRGRMSEGERRRIHGAIRPMARPTRLRRIWHEPLFWIASAIGAWLWLAA